MKIWVGKSNIQDFSNQHIDIVNFTTDQGYEVVGTTDLDNSSEEYKDLVSAIRNNEVDEVIIENIDTIDLDKFIEILDASLSNDVRIYTPQEFIQTAELSNQYMKM